MERQTGILCSRIAKRVEKLKDLSVMCIPSYAGGNIYQVKEGSGGEQFTADIAMKACPCRKWELCGCPCIHGVAAIGLQGEKVKEFVDECYSIAAYKRVYEPIICPCNGPNNWPKTFKTPVLPPPKMKLPGCPKTKRKKEEDEGVMRTKTDGTKELSRKSCLTLKCRICGGTDHNAKTCSHKKETTKRVEQNMNKCSLCHGLGHNRRSCQSKYHQTLLIISHKRLQRHEGHKNQVL